jgi:hypothetical protein
MKNVSLKKKIAVAVLPPYSIKVCRIQETTNSGRYYYFFPGQDILRAYVSEKEFLKFVRDAIVGNPQGVIISRAVEPVASVSPLVAVKQPETKGGNL